MEKLLPSIKTLRKFLELDAKSGKLFWLPRGDDCFESGKFKKSTNAKRWNTRYSGKPALDADKGNGYKYGNFLGQNLLAHRVIYAMHHGGWPSGQIDHINGDRADNRIDNLREVTNRENQQNTKTPKNNTSGAVGVQWYKAYGKWSASIRHDGRNIHLGYFSNFEAAQRARKEAELKFGYHENHGRKE